MNSLVLREMVEKSLAGQIPFPEVVRRLTEEGVESYHVDLLRGEYRYYAPNGESHVEVISESHPRAAEEFSVPAVQSALRAIQQGEIPYLEFIHRIMAAGTVYYIAYLAGKKVLYLGRMGDFHIENFPSAK